MAQPPERPQNRYAELWAAFAMWSREERREALRALYAAGTEDPHVLFLLQWRWASPPELAHDRSGERIGSFTLCELIDEGGGGIVYRAEQHIGPYRREVAVKLIHPTLLQTARDEAHARFLAEIGTLVKLEHESIARIYDGGLYEDPRTHDQSPYLAMELVREGLPLTTYARDYALAWPERLALFLRVCRAVQYAHEHRVVHRDLKPANILVDPDGRPVVIDFGLAQAYDALRPGTPHGASGTPAYMSPEQVADGLGNISTKSDVYALGLLLYELLTGQLPYALPGDGAGEALCQVITEARPPPLSQHDQAYGGELEAIVAAALAKRPAERLPLAVLRSRLERYLQTLSPAQARARHDMRAPQGALQPTRGLTAQPALAQAGTGASPLIPPAAGSAAGTSGGPGSAGYGMPGAERRMLTVMCCDLVGATALAGQLDPEDLREVLQAYRDTCAAVLARFGGSIDTFLGAEALICFGYPQAHEDAPQRAVRAGLGILEAMASVTTRLAATWNIQLAVRLGIHTGLVVVGDLGVGETRDPQAIVGETPHIAARLLDLAVPNSVVCSAATARLVDGYFILEALGPQVLTGVATPVLVHRVVGVSTTQTRLDIAATRGLTPLVGREPEVALLLERWAAAKEGRGQVIFVSGEAGIGKSRLVQAFTTQLTGEAYTRIVYYCSSSYQQSALYPVVDHLQQCLQLRTDDPPAEQRRKLEAALRPYDFALEEAVPLMAALLSVPLEHYPPLTQTPEWQKQKTLELLLAWLLKEAERQPVCVVLEDLHWADPSTLEWLGLLLTQIPMARVLLLLLFRPEFQPPWVVRSYIMPLVLSRLSSTQTAAMIEQVGGGKRLPAAVVQHLVATTDGVPLFVEELTKMVLASELVIEQETQYTLSGPWQPLAIPTTLHDALMARLDQVGPAKQVAQLGAVVGREFAYEVLQAVAPGEEATLQQGLARLIEAELLYQRGLLPQARYAFKHALIQEAAYQSLLKRTRRQYHHHIAQVLVEQFPETTATQPALVAYHYTEAGLIAQAIPYWQRAGHRERKRSAFVEAIAHLTQGLALLETLPDTPERTRQELDLQMALGSALCVTKGPTALDVERIYVRAHELCQAVGDTPQLFGVLQGLHVLYNSRGELQRSRELAEQLLSLAQHVHDPALLLAAHRALGEVLFQLAEFIPALAHCEQGIALAHQHGALAFGYGGGLGVDCLRFAARVLWQLGYPDQTLQRTQEALTLAQTCAHPHSLAAALCEMAHVHHLRREGPQSQEWAETAKALSREQGFWYWLTWGTFTWGWTCATQGVPERAIAEMCQSVAAKQDAGHEEAQPFMLAQLAEVYRDTRQVEEGLRLLAKALAVTHRTGERWWEAELHRLKGELLLARSVGNNTEAETCFRQALKVGRAQGAKSLELRAAMNLSRLWQQQGKQAEARALLAPLYGWFTEGFDTADLQEAKALLEALGG